MCNHSVDWNGNEQEFLPALHLTKYLWAEDFWDRILLSHFTTSKNGHNDLGNGFIPGLKSNFLFRKCLIDPKEHRTPVAKFSSFASVEKSILFVCFLPSIQCTFELRKLLILCNFYALLWYALVCRENLFLNKLLSSKLSNKSLFEKLKPKVNFPKNKWFGHFFAQK